MPSRNPPDIQFPTAERFPSLASRSGVAAWLLGAGIGVWWLRIWLAQGSYLDRYVNFDAILYWVPLLHEAAAQWRTGTVPLWNPYQALGSPLLATLQVGAAYPLNLPYLILDTGSAWLITGILHHLIAGLGMYGLCRALSLGPSAALAGAAAYAFNGMIVAKYLDQPELICLAWLPALFACVEILMRTRTLNRFVLLVAVWALEVLGGHPETIAQSALLLGSYVCVQALGSARRQPREALSMALAGLAAGLCALAVCAFQIVPTVELVQHSVRAIGALSGAQQAVLSATLDHFSAGSAGRAPLALALVAILAQPRRRTVRFFGAAALGLAVLSLGNATPALHIFSYLPTGTWFRAPVRFLNLLPLCIALLAAEGIEYLLAAVRAEEFHHRLRLVVGVLALSALFRLLTGTQAWTRIGLVFATFDAVPLVVCLVAARPRAVNDSPLGRWAVIGLFIVLALPGFYLQRYLSPLKFEQLYGAYRQLFETARSQAPARVLSLLPFEDTTWAKLGSFFEVPVLNDAEPLSLADFQKFTGALRGEPPSPSLESALTVFMGELVPPNKGFDSRLLNLSGVRFVLVDPATENAQRAWLGNQADMTLLARYDNGLIYANHHALPRAFFVDAGAVRTAGDRCLDQLLGADFDASRSVLLDHIVPITPTHDRREAPQVAIGDYTPGAVHISIRDSDVPGFVVLTDAFYPGWRASIDGVDVPISRADCFFRAVPIGTGAREITFEYAPQSFRIGLGVSGIAVLALISMLARKHVAGRIIHA